MFPLEQGAFEMLLIGAIALIVVGPKDLPMLMRKVGQFTGKMRGLAAEFRASFDEMARQSELDELRKEVEALRTGTYTAPISAEIDQHLSDFNPYPSGYPSPTATEALPDVPPVADGEEHYPQGGDGVDFTPNPSTEPVLGLVEAETPGLVPFITSGEPEVAATLKKPRAPRKPKITPASSEAKG